MNDVWLIELHVGPKDTTPVVLGVGASFEAAERGARKEGLSRRMTLSRQDRYKNGRLAESRIAHDAHDAIVIERMEVLL